MRAILGEVGRNLSYLFEATSIGGPEEVKGYLEVNSDTLPEIVDTKDIVEVLEADQDNQRIRIQLRRDAAAQDSIRIHHDQEYHNIPLLSAPSFYIVHSLLEGNTDQAISVLEEYYGQKRRVWRFRNDCRDALCFRAFADVLNQLSGTYEDAEHVQFRSVLGYFAKRILDRGPQGIKSFESLQQRIEYWNSCEHLKQTNVAEVVAEKLGRNSYRSGISNEREDLNRIEYDSVEFDPEWETVAPAAWLSHLLVSHDIIQAEEFVKRRPEPQNEEYEVLKQDAFDAGFKSRGPKWGQALSLSAAANEGDLRYNMFQYLRWTAQDCRTKGKFVPLLYKGALAVLPRNMDAEQEQRLRASRYMAIGHNWRRDNATENEIESFEIAKRIARGTGEQTYNFNSGLFVAAEASLVHAFAKSMDNPERRKGVYQVGLKKIRRLRDTELIDQSSASSQIGFLEDELKSVE